MGFLAKTAVLAKRAGAASHAEQRSVRRGAWHGLLSASFFSGPYHRLYEVFLTRAAGLLMSGSLIVAENAR